MNYPLQDTKPIDMCLLRNGCKTAFKQVFDKYHQAMLYYAFKITKCTADAEDVASDAFVKLHTCIATLQTEKHMAGFLFRVAHNKAIDKLRARKRSSKHEEQYARLYQGVSPLLVEHKMIKNEELKHLHACLHLLPPKNQAIVQLYLQGLSYKEIAYVQNITPSNVLHHIRNAADSLRKLLGNNNTNTARTASINYYKKNTPSFFNKQPLARII